MDPRLSPDGTRVAFVRDHDLWVWDLRHNRGTQVTKGGSELVTQGEAEFVAQEELDRSQGYWWAPDGRRLLFEEADAHGVEVWHVGDAMSPETQAAPQFYPRPGHANVKVRQGLVSAKGGRVTWVRWDAERYPYVARADWHASGGLVPRCFRWNKLVGGEPGGRIPQGCRKVARG